MNTDSELRELLIAAFISGYVAGHCDTVDGSVQVCQQGERDRAKDWYDTEINRDPS